VALAMPPEAARGPLALREPDLDVLAGIVESYA
jgi:hypothetical protein